MEMPMWVAGKEVKMMPTFLAWQTQAVLGSAFQKDNKQ